MEHDPIAIEQSLEAHRAEIKETDLQLACEMGAVQQACDEVRRALSLIEEHLETRDGHAAAQVGYEELASGFIFLQRVLGSLTDRTNDRDTLVSQIAMETRLPFEHVVPHVNRIIAEEQERWRQENPELANASSFAEVSAILEKRRRGQGHDKRS